MTKKGPTAAELSKFLRFYNKDCEIRFEDSRGFVDQIWTEIGKGYGFVPFIGAGFSVTAGIPIIKQLSVYLQRCICIALGLIGEDPQYWNPRTDQWPPFIDRSPDREERDWEKTVCKRYREERTKKNKNETHNAALYQEAYGAMADWRTSLVFLSRLILVKSRIPDPPPGVASGSQQKLSPCGKTPAAHDVVLGTPLQSVVDACWREVMRNKRPSLNHRMLATISTLLRIDLILTTNFDGLIEEAFSESGNPLEVLDMHLEDALPTIETLVGQRAIIKMHGSLHSLRADYSLDGQPSLEDQYTFHDYLAGTKLPRDKRKFTSSTKSHLILIGVGGSELRTKTYLKSALLRFPDLKIFWIAHTPDVLPQIEAFAKEILAEIVSRRKTGIQRIHVLRNTEPGLLFLLLHQWVRKTLPLSGGLFPSASRLALPPLPSFLLPAKTPTPNDKPKKTLEYEKVRDRLEEQITNGTERLAVVVTEHPICGASSLAAEVFRRIESKRICLWLDMNDIHSADDLFETFQEASYRKLGELDWTPLYAAKDRERLRSREVERIVNSTVDPWVLFLNARETAGANRKDFTEDPNGWINKDTNEEDDPDANREAFVKLVDDMLLLTQGRLKIVLVCWNPLSPSVLDLAHHCRDLFELSEDGIRNIKKPYILDPKDVLNGFLNTDDQFFAEKQRFVQTLVFIQRPRYLATAWARCVRKQWELSNSETDSVRLDWLNELENCGLLRFMDGGFLWFSSKVRNDLRKHFINENATELASIHLSLATWYRKVFDATNTVPAVFEVADHLNQSALMLLEYGDRTENIPQDPQVTVGEAHKRLEEATRRINSICELLRDQYALIETRGHPRVSMRRLDYIRDFWTPDKRDGRMDFSTSTAVRGRYPVLDLEDKHIGDLLEAIAGLQRKAVEVARGIAREIGEDGEAYKRMRELGHRLTISPEKPVPYDEAFRRSIETRGSGLTSKVFRDLYGENDKSDRLPAEWIRWCRWCGSLGNTSRSTVIADTSLRRIIQQLIAETEFAETEPASARVDYYPTDDLLRWSEALFTKIKHWKLTPPGPDKNKDKHDIYLETIRALETAAFGLSLQSHTQYRYLMLERDRRTLNEDDKKRVHELLQNAETLAVKGLEFVERTYSFGEKRDSHDYEIARCKSRLLMVAGIVSMRDPDRKKASRHAMSLLEDAGMSLNAVEDVRAKSELAILELRRAEIRLEEAGDVVLCPNQTRYDIPFQKWVYDRLLYPSMTNALWTFEGFPISQQKVVNLLQQHAKIDPTIQEKLREVGTRARDAIRFLDKGEPLLRELRRNVWWTTWYFERRLRAMSLVLWSSVADEGTPVPYLGLEAAMRGTETEPDAMLYATLRMVRGDSYRLAMVLLEYASCARAFQIRLALEAKSLPEMPHRLGTMATNLRVGLAELSKVRTLRDDRPKSTKDERCFDEKTLETITLVENRVKDVIAGLVESLPSN